MRVIILAAILAVMAVSCQADKQFADKINAMQTFDQLVKAAKNETFWYDIYVPREGLQYYVRYVVSNRTLNYLINQFTKDETEAGLGCFLPKLDYQMTRDDAWNRIAEYEKFNVTAYLEKKYEKQIKTMFDNVQKVQDAAKKAAELQTEGGKENDIKKLMEDTKRDIIDANKNFYDAAQKVMKKRTDDIEVEIKIRRGKIAKKGKRLRKCNLGA